uniref:C-type lectin domain-containing protein n=1 Tax=Denticeps clupeoides TaxID=299321 RepID=A0AAY4CT76_9TELE
QSRFLYVCLSVLHFPLLFITGACRLCPCAGLQYHFVNENMTWTEAQSYCRGNYTDLATVEDTEDMMMMVDITVQDWVWSDQNNSTYRNWTAGRLNNKASCAVAISQGGTWMDKDCGARFPFICYQGEI